MSKYLVTYIDNCRYFEGELETIVYAKTSFQAINKVIQDDNKNIWEIVRVEKLEPDSGEYK